MKEVKKGSGTIRKKNWKWWLAGILAILIAVVVCTTVFWDAVLIRIAPKAVLTSALSNVFSQLEERFQGEPLLVLARALDAEGKYTADVELNTENKLLGTVNYDMIVQTDGSSHRLIAEGTAATAEKDLDLSLYLDADFMAVSSNDLVKGAYYGITYDTFSEDIRSIPLLNFIVSSTMLSQWDASVQSIQTLMRQDYPFSNVPDMEQGGIRKLLFGIAALPSEIETRSVLLNGESVECQVFTYHIEEAQIKKAIGTGAETDITDVVISFYLYQKSIVQVKVDCTEQERTVSYLLNLGLNPAEDPLTLHCTEDNGSDLLLAVSTQHHDGHYIETWNLQKNTGEESELLSVSYDWDLVSGEMQLKGSSEEVGTSLTFQETENGFQLVADDLSSVLAVLSGEEGNTDSSKLSCAVTVSKGSAITTPEYKNLDQWSFEDFLTLLSGVGSLIGIDIG